MKKGATQAKPFDATFFDLLSHGVVWDRMPTEGHAAQDRDRMPTEGHAADRPGTEGRAAQDGGPGFAI